VTTLTLGGRLSRGPGALRQLARGSVAAAVALTLSAHAGEARAEVLEVGANGTLKVLRDVPDATWSSDAAEQGAVIPDAALTVIDDRTSAGTYSKTLEQVARAYDISPRLLEALIWQESRGNPAAVSRAGAVGLTQLMPATARQLGVDPRDPAQNLAGGAAYLRQQLNRFNGDLEKALAAYNAGPGRVTAAGGVPAIPETRAYVRSIVTRLASNLPTQGERQ
jgi:soluble lytic murein transglycosylase-like protein